MYVCMHVCMYVKKQKTTTKKLALLESAEEGNQFSTKECARREDRSRDYCLRSGHATDRATTPG